ncbi:MAG TPA: DUF4129 domain-containing protein [Pyrinomonadaceae bacterium]|nr:DUF4129 domain-containing protein [Pyrinomonadaceae bacterium]
MDASARAARLVAAALVAAALVAHGARAEERRAATLSEYRGRVREAVLELDALAETGAEADSEDAAGALGAVRLMLPRAERVEWEGGAVEVNNAWLHEALDAYEEEAGGLDDAGRAGALRDLAARLAALEARLAEDAGAGPARARDKDTEKGRLNTILRRPEYNREAARGGALRRLMERFAEWVRGLMPEAGPAVPGQRGGLSRAAQIFVFALSAAVLAYVFWRFWRRRERGPRREARRAARVVLGERLEADQTAADLLEEAERLARAGDLRAAIRKAYVALLCELGDRRVIRLAQHKTNRDYLQAVRRAAPRLYAELLPLTFNFELHWYGAQDASDADWADFRARCRSALRAL